MLDLRVAPILGYAAQSRGWPMECASLTLCIVDDDDAVRDSLRALLESYGLMVRDYASASEFLNGEPCSEPGCLIVDLHMPGMDGLELIELLRRRRVQTPAILLTGRHDQQVAARALETGVLVVLQKPVLADELSHWIDCAFQAQIDAGAGRN